MRYPKGRCGLSQFLETTGISRTRFFRDYRWSQRWIDFFDIRMNASGYLNFDLNAARDFGQRSIGEKVSAQRDQNSH
jgi:hypothetical protein